MLKTDHRLQNQHVTCCTRSTCTHDILEEGDIIRRMLPNHLVPSFGKICVNTEIHGCHSVFVNRIGMAIFAVYLHGNRIMWNAKRAINNGHDDGCIFEWLCKLQYPLDMLLSTCPVYMLNVFPHLINELPADIV